MTSNGFKHRLRNTARRRHEGGFTLVELLVVLVILVLLASIIGPRVIGYLGSSLKEITYKDITEKKKIEQKTWGGWLGIEYAVTHPEQLKSCILSSTSASSSRSTVTKLSPAFSPAFSAASKARAVAGSR